MARQKDALLKSPSIKEGVIVAVVIGISADIGHAGIPVIRRLKARITTAVPALIGHLQYQCAGRDQTPSIGAIFTKQPSAEPAMVSSFERAERRLTRKAVIGMGVGFPRRGKAGGGLLGVGYAYAGAGWHRRRVYIIVVVLVVVAD